MKAATAVTDPIPNLEVRQFTKLALIFDKTRSSNQFHLEPPSADDLRPLLQQVAIGGGCIGDFWVRSTGATRGGSLCIPPPKPLPQKKQTTSLSKAAAEAQAYKAKFSQWRDEEGRRREEAGTSVDRYLARLASSLEGQLMSQESAVIEALTFATRFLDAPSHESLPPLRIMAIFSDCYSSGRDGSTDDLQLTGAKILWLNPTLNNPPLMQSLQPSVFADTTQLLRHAIQLIGPDETALPSMVVGQRR